MTDEAPVNLAALEIEAVKRIALTNDGLLLHRFLRRQVESCRATTDSGALQRHEGARIFAHELMVIMAESIEAIRGGRTDVSDPSILTGASRGVAVGNTRSSRPRVALVPGDGWHSDDTADGSGTA